MTVPRFVDTNVLLYSISAAPAEEAKRRIAESIFDSRDLVLSVQVLGEFYVQATRPRRSAPIAHDDAAALVRSLSRYPVQALTERIVLAALDLQGRHSLSYWDATIIEAARAAGCVDVLSEELTDGADYGGVRVTNPFIAAR